MSAAPHAANPRGAATASRRFRGGTSRVVVVAPTAPRARPPSSKPPRTKAVGALQWVVKDPLINVYAADYDPAAGGAAHASHWKALEARRARDVVARGMYAKARQQRFAASGFSNLLVRLPYHPTAPQRRPIWKVVGRSSPSSALAILCADAGHEIRWRPPSRLQARMEQLRALQRAQEPASPGAADAATVPAASPTASTAASVPQSSDGGRGSDREGASSGGLWPTMVSSVLWTIDAMKRYTSARACSQTRDRCTRGRLMQCRIARWRRGAGAVGWVDALR